MTLRDTGCRMCLRTTSGDCGGHGPLILGSVSFGPPGSMKSEPFTLKPREDTSAKLQADLREKIAQLERECDALRAQVERLVKVLAKLAPADLHTELTDNTRVEVSWPDIFYFVSSCRAARALLADIAKEQDDAV